MSFFNKHNIVNRSNIVPFINHFTHGQNWHNIDKKNGNMGYGWIHYGLIRSNRPKNILVIGSGFGYIPAVCALACRDNKFGKVDFVDAGFSYHISSERDNAWGGEGFWVSTGVSKHFKKFKLNRYLKFHLMKSADFFNENKSKKWDYIYIDGDHSYKGVKNDFSKSIRHLNQNGFISMHDLSIKEFGGYHYGVKKFWEELVKSKKFQMMKFPGEYGLGLIQK